MMIVIKKSVKVDRPRRVHLHEMSLFQDLRF